MVGRQWLAGRRVMAQFCNDPLQILRPGMSVPAASVELWKAQVK